MNIEDDIWLPVPGYEGHLMASMNGKIKSLDRFTTDSRGRVLRVKGKQINPFVSKRGYYIFSINCNRKKHTLCVHFVMYVTFIGVIPVDCEIDHKDRNPLNNILDNLRAVTKRENAQNTKRNKKVIGVSEQVNKKSTVYTSSISIKSKNYHLGTFKTTEEAKEKYYLAEQSIVNGTFEDFYNKEIAPNLCR